MIWYCVFMHLIETKPSYGVRKDLGVSQTCAPHATAPSPALQAPSPLGRGRLSKKEILPPRPQWSMILAVSSVCSRHVIPLKSSLAKGSCEKIGRASHRPSTSLPHEARREPRPPDLANSYCVPISSNSRDSRAPYPTYRISRGKFSFSAACCALTARWGSGR